MKHTMLIFLRTPSWAYLLICLARGNVLAATDFDTNLVLTVHIARETLLPHEPLMLTVSLSNTSAVVNAGAPGRWGYLTGIQFKEQSGERWGALTRWWEPEITWPPLPSIPIEPGKSVTFQIAFYPFDGAGDLRFLPDKRYLLRAAIQGSKSGDRLISTTKQVDVLQLPESEREAYAALLKEKDLVRLLAPTRHVNDVLALPQDAEAFVSRFPGSVYSDYIRFSYVTYAGRGRFSTNQSPLVSQYRADLLRTRPWLLEFGNTLEKERVKE